MRELTEKRNKGKTDGHEGVKDAAIEASVGWSFGTVTVPDLDTRTLLHACMQAIGLSDCRVSLNSHRSLDEKDVVAVCFEDEARVVACSGAWDCESCPAM
ncbi:uncharacterized protein BO72DRAFT_183592 [Aspergillus fijiensis CBS 313.89]|uniref:Uncharacterized protein n=1 Tax=Aspergillus fijiensis CBS 313.89 TaxID=1448319 RepID=A0A8G1RKW8_9EURO|nr:uncharacterized protein BO72DRAFT_183592 [Aspergillus fijiensis CBS 313.89]RAK75144.1 hypothetical protein BO72DRAFT_183592 [Aspergillus fijiensis CBS 313.89]